MNRVALIAFAAMTLATAPAAVELVSDPAAMAKCERLGEVRSKSLLGGAFQSTGYKNALNSLKRKAGELGATHVQLVNGGAGWAGANMLGVAFKCEFPKAQ